MRAVARVVAVVFTVGFAVLAVPYVVLTIQPILFGRSAGPNAILVLVVYLVVALGLVAVWTRLMRSGKRS